MSAEPMKISPEQFKELESLVGKEISLQGRCSLEGKLVKISYDHESGRLKSLTLSTEVGGSQFQEEYSLEPRNVPYLFSFVFRLSLGLYCQNKKIIEIPTTRIMRPENPKGGSGEDLIKKYGYDCG